MQICAEPALLNLSLVSAGCKGQNRARRRQASDCKTLGKIYLYLALTSADSKDGE